MEKTVVVDLIFHALVLGRLSEGCRLSLPWFYSNHEFAVYNLAVFCQGHLTINRVRKAQMHPVSTSLEYIFRTSCHQWLSIQMCRFHLHLPLPSETRQISETGSAQRAPVGTYGN